MAQVRNVILLCLTENDTELESPIMGTEIIDPFLFRKLFYIYSQEAMKSQALSVFVL